MISALLTVGLMIAEIPPPPAGDWEFVFEEEGVVVTQLEQPEHDLPLYRATGVMTDNLYEVVAVLNDFSRHREWMRFMTETKIIWRADDFHLIVYILFDMPWPVWDRDGIMSVEVDFDRDKQEVLFAFNEMPLEQIPEKESTIRVQRALLYARLKYLEPNQTEMDLWMNVDPEGDLPRWLVRWFSKRVPLQALERLRDQVAKTRGSYGDFLAEYDPNYKRP